MNRVHSRFNSVYLDPLQPAKLRPELDEPESPSPPFPSDGYTYGSNHVWGQTAQTGSLIAADDWKSHEVGAAAPSRVILVVIAKHLWS